MQYIFNVIFVCFPSRAPLDLTDPLARMVDLVAMETSVLLVPVEVLDTLEPL